MELADILSEESVLVCSEVTSKQQLLELLAQAASRASGHDAGAIEAALAAREALGSTGLGNGIAIPHGKLSGLPGVVAVFARLDPPLDFDSIDDQPVDLVMMLLAPLGSGADHLKALARVARTLRSEVTAEQIRRATDPGRIYRLLTGPVTATEAA